MLEKQIWVKKQNYLTQLLDNNELDNRVLNVLKQQLSSSRENPLRIFNIFILYLEEFKNFFIIIYQQWTSLHPGQMKVSKQK